MFPDLLIERGKAKKDAWFKDNQRQLMNLENMNTFSYVYNLQGIASLGVRVGGWEGGGNKLVLLETLDQNIGT